MLKRVALWGLSRMRTRARILTFQVTTKNQSTTTRKTKTMMMLCKGVRGLLAQPKTQKVPKKRKKMGRRRILKVETRKPRKAKVDRLQLAQKIPKLTN